MCANIMFCKQFLIIFLLHTLKTYICKIIIVTENHAKSKLYLFLNKITGLRTYPFQILAANFDLYNVF